MSRAVQDQFIDDDEEETCPLCVEEFDLSDKNFRPCPCGYQICQFCYNNIKTTMNGLCPHCRSPYDDKNIEWKVPSAEEIASHKADVASKAKKTAVARQKEAQKREADSLSRKHLAGLRVVQKNLVYVTGLQPSTREDLLLQTLRGDAYFGQYGKIIKIVVSKPKGNAHGQESVGVYVTFARKEDAEKCIAAVDGNMNNGRTLRAQYGTTKYCSAYLRNETCTNRNCMFLHEPGEASDSFTRQDLSSMNSISTQQPTSIQPSSSRSPQPQPPPQQAPQPIASATQPMSRQGSRDTHSPSDNNDGPALPSTASWASKPIQSQLEKGSSGAPSVSNASPVVSHSALAQGNEESTNTEGESSSVAGQEEHSPLVEHIADPPPPAPLRKGSELNKILSSVVQTLANSDLSFSFALDEIPEEDLSMIEKLPPLFDAKGGMRRKEFKQQKEQQQQEQRQRQEVETQIALQTVAATEPEENPESGSLQLGGEPDDQEDVNFQRQQNAIQPPSQANMDNGFLGNGLGNLNLNGRSLASQQQEYQLLQALNKPNNPQANLLLNSFQSNQGQQQSLFGGLNQHGSTAPGHARQSSKFNFANDNTTTSKPTSHGKAPNHQPHHLVSPAGGPHSGQHQGLGNQFFSSVQGPPPGLKTTGTPPVSGGGMFGQGHGFANNALGYNAGLGGRNTNDDYMNDLMRRGRNSAGVPMSEAGKRESHFPSFLHQHPPASTPAPAPGLLSFPYGPQSGPLHESGPQKPKKKGKKHRHANTSSSGGGVVDLADPSILQARLHQGAATGNQGLYAGQGQDPELPDIDLQYQPRHIEEESEKPTDAPFDHNSARHVESTIPSDIVHGIEEGRRSTPALPPGLPVPAAVIATPKPAHPVSNETGSKQSQIVTPAVPILPAPIRPATPKVDTGKAAQDKSNQKIRDVQSGNAATEIQPDTSTQTRARPTDGKPAKDAIKPTNQSTSIEDQKSAKARGNDHDSKRSEAAAPAHPEKPKELKTDHLAAAATAQEKATQRTLREHSSVTSGPELPTKSPSTKRQPPGKLDIPQSSQSYETASMLGPSATEDTNPERSARALPTLPSSSRPETPSTTLESPLKRTNVPRTLRVLSTPKAETPPSASTAAPPLPGGKALSRQPSVVSMNRSGTPASEMISETNSTTSASLSRANSPPPAASKISSAPVRVKTKSQLKKERQDRAKAAEQDSRTTDAPQASTEAEIVAAPLTGRKKKAKKEKQPKNKAAAIPTSAADQPHPPVVEEKAVAQKKAEITEPVEGTATEAKDTRPTSAQSSPRTPKPEITAASIFADLQAAGLVARSILENFKQIPSINTNQRYDLQKAEILLSGKLQWNVSESQRAAIVAGEPVRLGGEHGPISRNLITPLQKFLRGLTKEEEDRYLELEQSILSGSFQTKFTPTKTGTTGITVPTIQDFIAADRAIRDAEALLASPLDMDEATMDDVATYLNTFMGPCAPNGKTGKTYEDDSRPSTLPGGGHTRFNLADLYSGMSGWRGSSKSGENLSVKEAESQWTESKKKTDKLEKELNALIKRNRKILTGAAH
ncbi:MAG: transcriptional repressor general negative regulator of transcription subunit 4 [Bogoriella megaspora]|nr:MAG: transcriptional repressor general negative regulator of transcription subunit 4 [Bogoriella megaspora]